MACQQRTSFDLAITGEVINKSINTFTLSKRYVLIMVKSSILNILYRRIELDDLEFKTRKYKNVPFIVFKNKTVKHPFLKNFMSWKKAITDAIDKNYLKEIYIFMKDLNTGEILETYNFRLKYDLKDKGTEYKPTLIYVQDSTVELLQAIYDLKTNDKLGSNTLIDVEFTYFPNTPPNYEPPGFEESPQPDCIKIKSNRHRLGILYTGFHKLSCYGIGGLFEERAAASTSMAISEGKQGNEEDGNSGDDMETTGSLKCNKDQADEKKTPKIIVLEDLNLKDKYEINTKVQNNAENIFNMTNITISDTNNTSVMTEDECDNLFPKDLNCFCELKIEMNVGIITCLKCKRMYHAPCHGFLQPFPKNDKHFRCLYCNTTDRILADSDEKGIVAKVRLMSYFLNETGKLNEDVLNSFGEKEKERILQKCKKFKIYDTENGFDKSRFDQIAQFLFARSDSQYLV